MKTPLVVLGAIIINLGLFLLMENMVARDNVRLLHSFETQTIDFVHSSQDEQTKTKDRRRKPPPKPEEINRPKTDMTEILAEEIALPSPLTALDVTSSLGIGGIALGNRLTEKSGGDVNILLESDLTPISKFPPQYPPTALSRSIEGFVEILFVVRPDGTVANPQVVNAQPFRIFDRSALDAVRRWRYRPVMVDGRASSVTVKVLVEYELDG